MPPNDSAFRRKQSSIEPPAIRTPAIAGPGDARRVDQDALQADRAHDPVRADDLDHERLARRQVDRQDDPAREHQRHDHPGGDVVGDRQPEEDERGDRHQRLGEDQQAALGHGVGDEPAPGADQKNRQELKGGGDADGQRASP